MHLGGSLERHARNARLLSNAGARQRRHAAAVHKGAVHLVHLLSLLRNIKTSVDCMCNCLLLIDRKPQLVWQQGITFITRNAIDACM